MKRILALAALLWASVASAQMVSGPGQTGSGHILGTLKSANMNTTADQSIPVSFTNRYVVDRVLVTGCSMSLTLAVGGVYPTTSKGGTALVANTQVYSALTGSTVVASLTLAGTVAGTAYTAATLYLSLTTAQGSAATCDVYVIGYDLP